MLGLGAQTKHKGGMQRSCDWTGCGGHGGGEKEIPIELDIMETMEEGKKVSIKLNVVEEDEEPPPILKF